MEASIRLGRVRGIEVGIHYSWFIVFVVFSFIFAQGQYPNLYPDWTQTQYWIVGVASVILLFVSVLVHEFAHAITAQKKGIPVHSITLFIFGGVAALSQESEEPGDEFQIAIAGPIASVMVGLLFGGFWFLVRDVNAQLAALTGYLFYINLVLAVFNMIPGFPLDGGRVLRAIIWKVSGNLRRATRITTTIGSLIGTAFIFLGILAILQGAFINGLWLIVLGWFLQSAAQQGYRQVEQQELLRGQYVRDIMNRQPIQIPLQISISEFVSSYVFGLNSRGGTVVYDDEIVGIVTVTDIKKVERELWDSTAVREIMTPLAEMKWVGPDVSLNDALGVLAQHDINQIPVIDEGRLVGVVTRSDFMRYMQLRQELGAEPRRGAGRGRQIPSVGD